VTVTGVRVVEPRVVLAEQMAVVQGSQKCLGGVGDWPGGDTGLLEREELGNRAPVAVIPLNGSATSVSPVSTYFWSCGGSSA